MHTPWSLRAGICIDREPGTVPGLVFRMWLYSGNVDQSIFYESLHACLLRVIEQLHCAVFSDSSTEAQNREVVLEPWRSQRRCRVYMSQWAFDTNEGRLIPHSLPAVAVSRSPARTVHLSTKWLAALGTSLCQFFANLNVHQAQPD